MSKDVCFEQIWMDEAFKQAEIGKSLGEVPVGAAFVDVSDAKNNKLIKSAHNQTNATKNGTKHCEIVCIDEIDLNGPFFF